MASLNSTSFIGNLAADPIIKTVGNQTVANFRIAVNETYNEKEYTTWINVSAWNDLANHVAENLHKGTQVYVSGRLDIKTWDREVTAPNSQEVFSVKTESMSIVADEVFSTDTMGIPDVIPVDNEVLAN